MPLPLLSPHCQATLSQLRQPVDIALIGDHAYITDESPTHPAIYVINIKHIGQSFGTAEEGASGGSDKGRVVRVGLRGASIGHVYGLAALPDANELFVGCRQRCTILLITLGTITDGVMETFCQLPAPPSGLDVVGATASRPAQLVVATHDAVQLIDRGTGTCLQVLQVANADFIGVCFAPAALGGALYAIDRSGNAVLRLKRHSSDSATFAPAASVETLAGGNSARPCNGAIASLRGRWFLLRWSQIHNQATQHHFTPVSPPATIN